jgi:hypothetical protein
MPRTDPALFLAPTDGLKDVCIQPENTEGHCVIAQFSLFVYTDVCQY